MGIPNGRLGCLLKRRLIESVSHSTVSSVLKAIPHNDCRADTQSAFSLDCPKRRRNTGVFQVVLSKNDGKDASVCAAKYVARSLRGVALKNECKPDLKKCWCIPPEQNAAFVAAMEEFLPYTAVRITRNIRLSVWTKNRYCFSRTSAKAFAPKRMVFNMRITNISVMAQRVFSCLPNYIRVEIL